MKLHLKALVSATAAIAALSYLLCALAVAVAPQAFMTLVGHVAHADLSGIPRVITWSGLFIGLVAWTLFSVLTVALTAALYNRWAHD
jgi:hypothetical protein